MKRILKYIVGGILFCLFFLAIDSTGIGFKTQVKKIGNWANGKTNLISIN